MKKEKEKIIQIAYPHDAFNPTILTNKGRILTVDFTNPGYPVWKDITPILTKIKKSEEI